MTLTFPAGTAVPTARADGTLAVYQTTYYPAAPTIAEAAIVSVTSGQERSAVDIQLQAVRTVRVSGNLLAPQGMADNVGIRLIPAGPDLAVNDVDAATTITDETGGFIFPGVPPGQYVLRVVRVPRLPADLDDSSTVRIASGGAAVPTSLPPPADATPPPIPSDATLFAEIPLSIGDHDLSNLIVPLRVGPRMSGHVEFDGASDRPDQQALTNVRITLDPADGSPAAPGLSFVTGHPDETGQFATYGVPSGKYVVRVAGLAFPNWVLKGVFYQGHDLTDEPIDMTSSDITGVTLTLTDRPASLVGTVSSGGVPDGNAVVLVYPRDATAWASSGALSRRMRVARPGADGTYMMPSLAAGEYNVVAVEEDLLGEWQDPALLEALSRRAEHVLVRDGDRKLVNLNPAAIR
jgi:hypothetical protein